MSPGLGPESPPAEVLRDWLEADDRFGLDNLDRWLDSDIEWVVAREHPASTTHRGIPAVRAYLADWQSMVPDMRFEIDEYEERGDRVLAIGRFTGSGAGSGAGAPVRLAILGTVRGGKTVRIEEFLDADEGRRALARE